MIVHQVFAEIFEEKVQNIIVCDNYEMANYLARAAYGDLAFAVDCLQYPCGIGDYYSENRFWKEDSDTGERTEIMRVATEAEKVVSLEEELTNTQLALVELYEGMEV